MNTIVLLPFILGGAGLNLFDEARVIARTEISNSEGFAVESDGGRDGDAFVVTVSGRRSADHASIATHISKAASEANAEKNWVWGSPSVKPGPAPAFSELPVGTVARCGSGTGNIWSEARDGSFTVKVSVRYAGTGPRGSVAWQAGHRPADKLAVEGILRRSLAKCRGLQAVSAGNTTLNGTVVAQTNGPRGERLVDLTRYCQAYNLQLSTNQILGTASFTAGGEQVIIPLAAKSIKDGARWIDTTDISLIKEGKWFVSYAALEEARRH